MSKTKAIQVRGRLAWALDNAHDVVLARMVEAAEERGGVDEWLVDQWRVAASIADLAFSWDGPVPDAVMDLVVAARAAIDAFGDMVPEDFETWSVFDGERVSGGFLRHDRLSVDCLHDTVEGLAAMLGDELPADPPYGWWCFGFPGGRAVVQRRWDAT